MCGRKRFEYSTRTDTEFSYAKNPKLLRPVCAAGNGMKKVPAQTLKLHS